MSTDRDDQSESPADERDPALPALRSWWSELSPAGKVLIPVTAAMLVFVTASAVPPLVL